MVLLTSCAEKCYIIIVQFSVLTTLNQQQYLELSINSFIRGFLTPKELFQTIFHLCFHSKFLVHFGVTQNIVNSKLCSNEVNAFVHSNIQCIKYFQEPTQQPVDLND